MLERALIFAAAICGFAIFAVPKGGDDDTESDALKTATSASPFSGSGGKSKSQSDADWFAGDHTLDRESDGHFYASASIDGANIRMMVDTGASVIALTGPDAAAAGVYWGDDEVRHIGSGANGAVYGVPVTLREVEIGGMVRRNVQAVVIPRGLGISLLGQSYLSQIGAVEIADDQMIMRGS